MKPSFLIAVICFFGFRGSAQVYERTVIHSNDNLSGLFRFRFPSFQDATVLLKNGGSLKTKMNFNLLLCNMQFIDPKGDTLEITQPQEIDSVRFDHSTFFLHVHCGRKFQRCVRQYNR